jgi:hypothetical protein
MLMRCSAVRTWEASDRLIPKGQGKKVACSQTDKVSQFHHDDRHRGTLHLVIALFSATPKDASGTERTCRPY